MCLVLLAGAALPTMAQGRRGDYRRGATQYGQGQYDRRYDTRYDTTSRSAYDRRGRYDRRYQDRSFWDKHRDKVTVAAGTGAGALIGGVAGGRKGAVIGALLGAGGSALYKIGRASCRERV